MTSGSSSYALGVTLFRDARRGALAAGYLALAMIVITACVGCGSGPDLAVKVAGNMLVDAQGQQIRLLGVTAVAAANSIGIAITVPPAPP